jgi:hypothetical protein
MWHRNDTGIHQRGMDTGQQYEEDDAAGENAGRPEVAIPVYRDRGNQDT